MNTNIKHRRSRYLHYKYYFKYWWVDIKCAIKHYQQYREFTITRYSGTLFGPDVKI